MRKFWIAAILALCMGLTLMLIAGCDFADIIDIHDKLHDDEGEENGDVDGEVDGEVYDPDIDPEDFVEGIDHPYFPLIPGVTYIYEGDTEDGVERIEVNVTDQTRMVLGVECMVVRDRVWLDEDEDEVWSDEELIEDTFDWYAQDDDGNVWYFGEDSTELEDGVAVSTEGSWESGVDGALPGVIMWAEDEMEIDVPYRQEYYEGEAEDMAKILSLSESVTIDFGSFEDCLQIEEWSPLDPGVTEHKFYAPGIGVILEAKVEGGDEEVELVDIIEP